MNFIDIVETNPRDKDWPRTSSLIPTDEGLKVMGNLPHGYVFRPKTERDRDRLVSWLQELIL